MRAKWQAVHRNYCSLYESLTDKPCLVPCLLLLQNLLAGEGAQALPMSPQKLMRRSTFLMHTRTCILKQWSPRSTSGLELRSPVVAIGGPLEWKMLVYLFQALCLWTSPPVLCKMRISQYPSMQVSWRWMKETHQGLTSYTTLRGGGSLPLKS